MPRMDEITTMLTDLHRKLATESFESKYEDYEEIKNFSAQFSSKADTNDSSEYLPAVKMTRRKPREKDHDVPLLPDNIRLEFPETFILTSETRDDVLDKLNEYLDDGINKEKLLKALEGSFWYRDHVTIANYMECVKMMDSPPQIEIIVTCLDYLAELAKDEHGSTDGDGANAWLELCENILLVLSKGIPDLTDVAAAKNVRPQLQLDLLKFALGALAALLYRKSIDEARGGIGNVLDKTCEFINYALSNFISDAQLVQNTAHCVIAVAQFSNLHKSNLHKNMTIGRLLDAIKAHRDRLREMEDRSTTYAEDSLTAIHSAAKALWKFPAELLTNPRPQIKRRGHRNAKPESQSDVIAATVANWTECFNTVMDIISDYQAEKEYSSLELLVLQASLCGMQSCLAGECKKTRIIIVILFVCIYLSF